MRFALITLNTTKLTATSLAATALMATVGLAGCASHHSETNHQAEEDVASLPPLLIEEFEETVEVVDVSYVEAPSAAAATLAAQRFEKLKTLEGAWVQADGDGGTQLEYEVTANGSALVETVFPGQPSEMVSVYTLDSGRLVMTHYCAMGNQPYMVAAESGVADVIRFECERAGNTNSHADPHMHLGVFTIGEETLKTEWTLYADLTPGMTVGFDLVRGGM